MIIYAVVVSRNDRTVFWFFRHSNSLSLVRGSTPEAINPQAIRRPRGPIADFRALLIEARGLSASQISWRKAELQRELAALTQAEAELIDREVDDGEV